MIITESTLRGAFTIEMVRAQDERGFFARSFSAEEFAAHGLPAEMPVFPARITPTRFSMAR